MLGGGPEQGVNGRAMPVFSGPMVEAHAMSFQQKMEIRRGDINPAGLNWFFVHGMTSRETPSAAKHLREITDGSAGQMRHDKERRRQIWPAGAKQLVKRFNAACRSADDDD